MTNDYQQIYDEGENGLTDFERTLCKVHNYPCFMCKFTRCTRRFKK